MRTNLKNGFFATVAAAVMGTLLIAAAAAPALAPGMIAA